MINRSSIVLYSGIIIVIIITITLLPTPKILRIGDNPKQKVLIEHSQVTGWHQANKLWQLNAELIWQGENHDLTKLTNIQNGQVYSKSGQMSLQNIKGAQGYAQQDKQQILVSGNVTAQYISPGQVTLNFSAQVLQLVTSNILLHGAIKVAIKHSNHHHDITINTHVVQIDLIHNAASFPDGLTWRQSSLEGQADFLTYDLLTSEGNLQGSVSLNMSSPARKIRAREAIITSENYNFNHQVIYGSKEVTLSCATLHWSPSDQNASATGLYKMIFHGLELQARIASANFMDNTYYLSGNVIIKRPFDTISSHHGVINSKQILMNSNVKVIVDQSQMPPNTHNQLKSLKETAVLTAQHLVHDMTNHTTTLFGQASITQSNQTAKAERLVYFTKLGKVLLRKNVLLKRGHDEWISCQRLDVNLESSTFAIKGKVGARIMIEK